MDTNSVDRATLAGDPPAHAAAQDPEVRLLEAAQAALKLLDRIDAHAPEGLTFGGEDRVRRQLRAAIRGAEEAAEDAAWADALDPDEAEALDDLRGTLGRMPSDGERSAYLASYRERRAQILGRTRGWEAPAVR